MENKKIWTPFKIWNETQWFADIDMFIKEFKKLIIFEESGGKNEKTSYCNWNDADAFSGWVEWLY